MQQPLQHQMMGYDRTITMFSPDGRLLQVEYARKAVKLGNAAIGIVCKDGIVLVTDKRISDKLIIADAVDKIFEIDKHIMTTAAGIVPDARVLIEHAQVKAQQNKVTYDTPIETLSVVKDLCAIMQSTTQNGGLRPFGVSLLIAGADKNGLRLYKTDPVGVYYQCKAASIGEVDEDIEKELEQEYKENMSTADALKLAVKILKKHVEDLNEDRVDAAIINQNQQYERLAKEKIATIIKSA